MTTRKLAGIDMDKSKEARAVSGRHSSVLKRPKRKTVIAGNESKRVNKKAALSLDDLLDIVALVDLKMNTDRMPANHKINPIAYKYAARIAMYSKSERTRQKAATLMAKVNNAIVLENMKVSDPIEGEILYNNLMRKVTKSTAVR